MARLSLMSLQWPKAVRIAVWQSQFLNPHMSYKAAISVAICARDAAHTIRRAMESVPEGLPVVLVDDASVDNTAGVAVACGRGPVKLSKRSFSRGIGDARQVALDLVETPYALWLDADDEMLPGRADSMLAQLEAGADLVFDPVILVDDETVSRDRLLPVPDFLRRPDGVLRCFERNWIPMIAGGFRTEFAKRIGYDTTLKTGEDYDFLLRALLDGATVRFCDEAGYRYHHRNNSLSRNLKMSLANTRRVLAKTAISALERKILSSRLPRAEAHYTLAATALWRRDRDAVERHTASMTEAAAIPPYGRPARDLAIFLRASARLLVGRADDAVSLLRPLAADCSWAEVENNLGVAYRKIGNRTDAEICFARALLENPDYGDARYNLDSHGEGDGDDARFTLLPLRPVPDRAEYG
ncbi:glycosyltransferase [Eilatimonas milleporae]